MGQIEQLFLDRPATQGYRETSQPRTAAMAKAPSCMHGGRRLSWVGRVGIKSPGNGRGTHSLGHVGVHDSGLAGESR